MRRAAMMALIFAAASVSAVAQQASAPSPQQPRRACFPITEMRGWKASGNRTIYIRVGSDRIFRLDLVAACPLLMMAGTHLVTKTRGSDLICSAVDWDLAVAEPPPTSMPEHCVVKKMTLLTPEQVSALPAKDRPR